MIMIRARTVIDEVALIGRVTLALVTGLVVACGPSEPAVAPSPSPAPVPSNDGATLVPATSQQTAPPASDPAADATRPTANANVELGLEQSCSAGSGQHLDLQWMLESGACYRRDVTDKKPPPPGALATRIEPAHISLAPGAKTSAILVIANATGDALEFDLRLNCAVAGRSVTIRDATGKRADVIEKCGHGSGCGGPSARLTLDPSGDARIPIDIAATFQVESDDCKRGPEQPLKPGEYIVLVEMPFGPPDASAPLTVRYKKHELHAGMASRVLNRRNP